MKSLSRLRLNDLTRISLVIAVVCTGAFAQAQSGPKENASVISGRITSDNQPLTNARVMVSKAQSNTSQNVRVDSEGNFSTPPLEPGVYNISAYVPGLIRDPAAPATSQYHRPGETIDIRMVKGGVITGSVKNANGDGLVAIPVRAYMVRRPNGDPLSATFAGREVLTDDRGIFRIFSLTPGSYIVSAGGRSGTSFGLAIPTAYEGYAPTYAPSATRDTATEIQVTSGSESQADIQFREERGHVISGTITGAKTSDGPVLWSASVSVFDPRNRFEVANGTANSATNFAFAVYGVMDGDYEIYATQYSSTSDQQASAPLRIKVQGADVTGLRLAVGPLASLDGRVTFENDPKAACGKRRASTLVETVINSRRFEPRSPSKENPPADIPSNYRNQFGSAIVDARGAFSIKNLQPGTYQLEPTAPAAGWFVRSVQFDRNAAVNVARDGVNIKRGDHVTGLTVTFAEGAAKLKGHLSAGEGQSLPLKLRVYLVPEERETAGNLYRYYEAAAERDGTFTIDNVAPGKYLILARRSEENEVGVTRLVRLDETLRTAVFKEAEALKKAIALKPCEQVADFDLPYLASPR
jgi:hypothetical protein